MLKSKPLSDLLSQVLSPSIETALLFNKSGSLLAQASNPPEQRRSRVVAALAASIWNTSGTIEDADEVSFHKGDGWLCIDLESGKVFVQSVDVEGSDLGVMSDGFLIGIQGNQDAQIGFLKIQARSLQAYLEAEFSKAIK